MQRELADFSSKGEKNKLFPTFLFARALRGHQSMENKFLYKCWAKERTFKKPNWSKIQITSVTTLDKADTDTQSHRLKKKV